MRLDGSNAQHEPLGDLVIGMTEGDQSDHLTLAPGQAVVLATPVGVARRDAHRAHEPWPPIPGGRQHIAVSGEARRSAGSEQIPS